MVRGNYISARFKSNWRRRRMEMKTLRRQNAKRKVNGKERMALGSAKRRMRLQKSVVELSRGEESKVARRVTRLPNTTPKCQGSGGV